MVGVGIPSGGLSMSPNTKAGRPKEAQFEVEDEALHILFTDLSREICVVVLCHRINLQQPKVIPKP
jgi:hypothetical protein